MGWDWGIYDKDDNDLLEQYGVNAYRFYKLGQNHELSEEDEQYFPDEDKIPWTPSPYTPQDLKTKLIQLASEYYDEYLQDIRGYGAQKVFRALQACVQENIDSLDNPKYEHMLKTYKKHCESCSCDVPPVFPIGWDLDMCKKFVSIPAEEVHRLSYG